MAIKPTIKKQRPAVTPTYISLINCHKNIIDSRGHPYTICTAFDPIVRLLLSLSSSLKPILYNEVGRNYLFGEGVLILERRQTIMSNTMHHSHVSLPSTQPLETKVENNCRMQSVGLSTIISNPAAANVEESKVESSSSDLRRKCKFSSRASYNTEERKSKLCKNTGVKTCVQT